MSAPSSEQNTVFGYRTPDGTEHWANEFSPQIPYVVGDLSTVDGQAATQARFRSHLRNSGLPENWGKLEFIQRVRSVIYSESIPLVPIQNGESGF